MAPKFTLILSLFSCKPLHQLLVEVIAAIMAAIRVTHSFNDSKETPPYKLSCITKVNQISTQHNFYVCGISVQPQCLHFRASLMTSSRQSGHLTWVLGDGAVLSASTDGITATAIRLNGPNISPSKNQTPANLALLFATIQQSTALPIQTKSRISIFPFRKKRHDATSDRILRKQLSRGPVQTSALAPCCKAVY